MSGFWLPNATAWDTWITDPFSPTWARKDKAGRRVTDVQLLLLQHSHFKFSLLQANIAGTVPLYPSPNEVPQYAELGDEEAFATRQR